MVWLAAIAIAAGDRLRRIFQHMSRRGDPLQHRLRLGQEPAAGGGKLDRAADPVEELHAAAKFQRLDGGRSSGLRHAKQFGGPGDVAALGYGDEDAELFRGHVPTKKHYRLKLQ